MQPMQKRPHGAIGRRSVEQPVYPILAIMKLSAC